MATDRLRRETEAALKQNWLVIASIAWWGYRNHGRGLLVIDDVPPKRMRYVARKEEPLSPEEAKKFRIDGWVRDYNPKREVIVVVMRAEVDYILDFRLAERPSPPEAYQLRRNRLEPS